MRRGHSEEQVDTGHGVRLLRTFRLIEKEIIAPSTAYRQLAGKGTAAALGIAWKFEDTRINAEIRRIEPMALPLSLVTLFLLKEVVVSGLNMRKATLALTVLWSRERGGRYDVNVNTRYETDNGRVSGGAGYRSGEGVSLRADGSRNFGETNVNAGVDANFGRETTVEILEPTEASWTVGQTVAGAGRARVDKSGTEVGLNVSSTLSRFRPRALTPKLDASLRSEKLKLAGHSSLDRGVRRQIMDANPGTVFVTGAVEGRFSGGISARVPVGPGSVEGGYTVVRVIGLR